MKALEFKGQISADGKVTLPDEIRRMVSPGTAVRVLILIPEEAQEEAAWQRLTVEEFLAGYDEADAIYDELPEVENVPTG